MATNRSEGGEEMYVLLISYEGDYDPPDIRGPFDSIEGAQTYAEEFRRNQGLPVEATEENNEEWTNAGWYFGIATPHRGLAV